MVRRTLAYILPTFLLAFPLLALGTCREGELCNPLKEDSLEELLRLVLQAVVAIAFPFLVLFLVFIGFKFVAASGNPEELKKVRNMFFWALVGALIVLGAQALSLAIEGTVEQLQAP